MRSKSMGLQPGFKERNLPKLGMAFGGQRVFRTVKKLVQVRSIEEAALLGAVALQDVANEL